MESPCSVTAAIPPAPSKGWSAVAFTISLWQPLTASATAHSAYLCRPEQVIQTFIFNHKFGEKKNFLNVFLLLHLWSISSVIDKMLLPSSSVPCPPSRVNVRMQRIDRLYWAMISWSKVTCPDVDYLAEISGQIENNPQALMTVSSYWLPRPYFEFPVPCSTAFNITVRAKNSAGIGKPSSPITALTGNFLFSFVDFKWNRMCFCMDVYVFTADGCSSLVPLEVSSY